MIRHLLTFAALAALLGFAFWLGAMALVRTTGLWLGPVEWLAIPVAAAVTWWRFRRPR